MSQETPFIYDQVLYPNYLHTQTHPDRLATMTKFFGLNPKPVESCRVLELGCGTGSSLLSFAYDLKGSEFIGIDLSARQIELGNKAVRGIGLKNLTLKQGDIMKITREEFGEFDYIIAHGLYSWVPEPVRDQIMKICRELLAPQGVAFISYNALPGCHFREMIRELMLFHTREIDSSIEKVQESLGVLKFVSDSVPTEKIHHDMLKKEFEKISERNFENIYHDELAEFNHPVYFHQFVAHAEKHGLQFVSEVEYFTGKNVNFPKEVLETLDQISGDDVVKKEQYLDFITCRRFRQTLLCHKEVKISSQPDPKILREVRISSPLRPESEKPELATAKHEVFVGEKKHRVEINHPLTKAALFYLGQIWVRSMSFDDLVRVSKELLAKESGTDVEITARDEEIITEILFQIFCSGMLQLHIHEPAFSTEVSEKPLASAVARWQAEESYSLSTLLSVGMKVQDALGIELIKLLDGTRDRRQLMADLTEIINSEKFDQPSEIKKNLLIEMPEKLEENLQKLAQAPLLIS